MVPDFWTVLQAVLLVLGILWCREILGRFREDLALVRAPKKEGDRGVVLVYWILTVAVIALMARFVGILLLDLVRALR